MPVAESFWATPAKNCASSSTRQGFPTVTTVMGIGAVPPENENSMDWLGMHGAAYANYAVRDCDLLIALGVRFDDRVTGKVEAFAKDAKIIHVDIDGSELNKNKEAHIPVRGDVKQVLTELNKVVTKTGDRSLASALQGTQSEVSVPLRLGVRWHLAAACDQDAQ